MAPTTEIYRLTGVGESNVTHIRLQEAHSLVGKNGSADPSIILHTNGHAANMSGVQRKHPGQKSSCPLGRASREGSKSERGGWSGKAAEWLLAEVLLPGAERTPHPYPTPAAPEAAPGLCTKELADCVHAYTGYILGHCFGGDIEPMLLLLFLGRGCGSGLSKSA